MVADKTLEQSIAAFGTRGKTHWHQIKKALNKFKVAYNPCFKRDGLPLKNELSIVRIRWKGTSSSHFLVYNWGTWWDPAWGSYEGLRPLYWNELVRISSRLIIFPPKR